MLDIVVASVVAQIVDGDSGADKVGKSKPFLDDLLGFGGRGETWAIDNVDCGFGEQIDRDMPFDFAHLIEIEEEIKE